MLSFGNVEFDSYSKNMATFEHCQRGHTDVKLVICYGQQSVTYLFIKHISATTRDYTEVTESTRTVYKFNEECERMI